MDIHSRSRNIFYSIGGVFLTFAICFCVYQYHREKESRIDIMHSRLQMYNYELLQTLGDSVCVPHCFYDYVKKHEIEGIRVTLIDSEGRVILDSRQNDVSKMKNHLQRTEVQTALKEGNGYDVKRSSESTGETYFYSATMTPNKKLLRVNSPTTGMVSGRLIIRTAIPYSTQLTESLRPDFTYLFYALSLTVFMGIVLFFSATRIGRNFGKELKSVEDDRERIKRQLTQNAAHELKTPTASIHGYLETIIEHPEMDAEQRQHFLERCYAQSERMTRLLKDMSTLTRLDEIPVGVGEGKNAFTTKVDVLEIISNVLEDTRLQLEEKGITSKIQLASLYTSQKCGDTSASVPGTGAESVEILGDAHLLYSIFRNLVDNALAYAQGATEIVIAGEKVPGSDRLDSHGLRSAIYEFTVSDNGVGVEAKHLFHLFERFYRVDKGRSRKLGGTGLGLAIVKNAVMAHGGTCSAEQTPGGGLTIKFSIQG